MYVGLKQTRGDGERYVTRVRAAAKETRLIRECADIIPGPLCYLFMINP